MLDIKTGRLYQTIREARANAFDEKHEVIKWIDRRTGSVLLAVSKPFRRARRHGPDLVYDWSCKFLVGKQVLELTVTRCPGSQNYANTIKLFIIPLEKSDA